MLANQLTYFSPISCKLDHGAVITSVSVCDIEDIIAVATAAGTISFFNSNGERKDTIDGVGSKSAHVSKLSWKPKKSNLLVCGRLDGKIICWSNSESSVDENWIGEGNEAYTNVDVHQSEINFIIWNSCTCSSQERFVTADTHGTCCLWKIDNQALILIPLSKHEKDSAISAITFLWPGIVGDKRNHAFLFGLKNGKVLQAGERGQCHAIDIQDSSAPIAHIFCYEEKSRILVVTQSFLIVKIELQDGKPAIIHLKAKLSVSMDKTSIGKAPSAMILTPCGHLISATGEERIRCWDLSSDESYELGQLPHNGCTADSFVSLQFDQARGILVAGTSNGKCFFWKRHNILESLPTDATFDQEKGWISTATCYVGEEDDILSIYRGPAACNRLVLQTRSNVIIIKENIVHSAYNDDVAALQIDRSKVAFFTGINNTMGECLETNTDITGVQINSSHMVIWSISEVYVYNIGRGSCELLSHLHFNVQAVALRGNMLYLAQDIFLIICDLSGVQKLKLRFPAEEGRPQHLDAAKSHLIIATDLGILKVFDISKKEPNVITPRVSDNNSDVNLGSIRSVRCNADGTIVSILSRVKKYGEGDYRYIIHLYDSHSGLFRLLSDYIDPQSCPVSHYWDQMEPKLFTCEIRSMKQNSIYPRILTLFVLNELEVHICEDSLLDVQSSVLVGIKSSCLLFIEPPLKGLSLSHKVCAGKFYTKDLSEFSGLNTSDTMMISAVVNFTCHLKSGSMSEAYNCARSLDQPTLWRKMAQFCVKNRSLDFAEMCLAQMGHASGTAAVRRAKREPEREVALAEIAIQLGMIEEAEMLYKQCQRLDLVCNLYRRRGLWEEALKISKESPVSEPYLHFYYGTHLEQKGEISSALAHFEQGSSKHVVLRKMIKSNAQFEKHKYDRNDKESIKWQASYIESTGNIEEAKKKYMLAGDDLSLVRIACLNGNTKSAFEIINTSGDAAAIYHFARYLEANGEVREAINCYARSGMYNHAIQLSKIYGFDADLMALAIKCQPEQMIECAHYYERKQEWKRAAELYVKGGDTKQAMIIISNTATQDQQLNFDENFVALIEDNVGCMARDIVEKYAKFLITSGQNEKAITLMTKKGFDIKYVLQFCKEHNILLTEGLAGNLLLQFPSEKLSSLKEIAEICKEQGNHNLACKMFTQAGDRSNAMKSLLRGGDTNSIISFARISRTREVYELAANYLQTLDWSTDQPIIKAILQFYSKAKRFDGLIVFLSNWSDTEALKGDYIRAMKLLKECQAYGKKINGWGNTEIYSIIRGKLLGMEQYTHAQEIATLDSTTAGDICMKILEENERQKVVRPGDCYSLLVKMETDSTKALILVEEMVRLDICPEKYISKSILETIYNDNGKSWSGGVNNITPSKDRLVDSIGL